jgi:hypothetical protein
MTTDWVVIPEEDTDNEARRTFCLRVQNRSREDSDGRFL